MTRKSSKWLVALLSILVLCSMGLTSLIVLPWNQWENTNVQTNQQSSTVQSRSMLTATDVFKPTRFIVEKEDKSWLSVSPSLLATIHKSMAGSIHAVNGGSELSQETYTQIVLRESRAQLLFDGVVALQLLSQYVEEGVDTPAGVLFNRIVFSSKDELVGYLINDETKTMYLVEWKQLPEEMLASYMNETSLVEAEAYTTKNGLVYVHKEAIEAKQKEYIAEQPATSYFVSHLYSNTTELRTRTEDQIVIYNDNVSQLSVDRAKGLLSYYKNIAIDQTATVEDLMERGFNSVRSIENWRQGIAYAGYNSERESAVFIRYIQEYPVLSQNDKGHIVVSTTSEGLRALKLPIVVAQTPLEDRFTDVTLEAGTDVVTKLMNEGIELSTIEDIRIGYDWKTSTENEKIIVFTPQWYIKVDSKWIRADSVGGIQKESSSRVQPSEEY